jgi:uncharacterized protein YeaO (DUF488 family)
VRVTATHAAPEPRVRIVRAYDPPDSTGQPRVLIDGLWPRGVRKADLGLHVWERDIAPSTELRKWFGHDPEKFNGFRVRYLGELREEVRAAALDRLSVLGDGPGLVIVTATADVAISHAEILRGLLSDPESRGKSRAKS